MRRLALLCGLLVLAGCSARTDAPPAGQVAATSSTAPSKPGATAPGVTPKPGTAKPTTTTTTGVTTTSPAVVAKDELTSPTTTGKPAAPATVAAQFAAAFYSLKLNETPEHRAQRAASISSPAIVKRLTDESLSGWHNTVAEAEPGAIFPHDTDWVEVHVWITYADGTGKVVPPGGSGKVIDVRVVGGKVTDYTPGKSSR